jgi:KDO2-lipid IV(A) lauroyltransferase
MERKSLIAWFLGFFLKISSGILWFLPRRLQLFLGDALALFVFDILRFRRKIALENLARAFPEKTFAERTALARASYRNLGRSLLEYSFFSFMDRAWVNHNYEVHGMNHYAAAASGDRGVLLLTLHLGNGDLGLAALALSGFNIQVISKHFRSEWLNKIWFGVREKMGLRFIPEEKSSFQILRALKSKAVVVFVLDQFMGPPVGVKTKFFGHETGTAAGLAVFSLKTGIPVLPGYTFRKPDGKMSVVFDPPILPESSGELDQDIERLTQAYTDRIEAVVRRHPDQWMWLHRRWKPFQVR